MKRQRRGGFLIGRIHQTAGRVFARVLRRHGVRLSPPQGRVLFSLWQDGAMAIAVADGANNWGSRGARPVRLVLEVQQPWQPGGLSR